MKRPLQILGVSVLVIAGIGMKTTTTPTAYADESPNPNTYLSTTTVRNYVYQKAMEYGVNPDLAVCITEHESQFTPWRDGKDTGNTLSRGLWQWNDYWHPEISNACAHDMKCSTDKALSWIKKGHVSEWSTRKLYCSKLPVLL